MKLDELNELERTAAMLANIDFPTSEEKDQLDSIMKKIADIRSKIHEQLNLYTIYFVKTNTGSYLTDNAILCFSTDKYYFKSIEDAQKAIKQFYDKHPNSDDTHFEIIYEISD